MGAKLFHCIGCPSPSSPFSSACIRAWVCLGPLQSHFASVVGNMQSEPPGEDVLEKTNRFLRAHVVQEPAQLARTPMALSGI